MSHCLHGCHPRLFAGSLRDPIMGHHVASRPIGHTFAHRPNRRGLQSLHRYIGLCHTLAVFFDPWAVTFCLFRTVATGGARPKAGCGRGV